MAGRCDTSGLVDVLEADWDAVQWPPVAAGSDLGLGGAGGRARLVSQHTDEAVEPAIEPLDALQAAVEQFNRRQFLGCDQPCRLGNGQVFRYHPLSPPENARHAPAQ